MKVQDLLIDEHNRNCDQLHVETKPDRLIKIYNQLTGSDETEFSEKIRQFFLDRAEAEGFRFATNQGSEIVGLVFSPRRNVLNQPAQ